MPELIPIWPPVIQRDSMIPIENKSPLLCAVSSGNSVPNVYVYSDSGVYKKQIEQEANGISLVEINVRKHPILLSVDRKYVGREVTIQSRDLPKNYYKYEIGLESKSGENISWQEIDSRFLSEEFTVLANAKFDLYTGTKDRTYRHVSIREQSTLISAQDGSTELFFVIESAIIRRISTESREILQGKYEDYGKLLQAANKGLMVSVPRWVDAMLRVFEQNHEDIMFKLVKSSIRNGKIHLELLKLLRLIDLDRTRAAQRNQK